MDSPMIEPLKSREALSATVDELGALARIVIDLTIYSRTAVFKAAYWYTEHCFLFLCRGDSPDTVQVEIRPKAEQDREALVVACREFCNALIDQQVRQDVIRETGEIREALVRKAFGEGRRTLTPTLLQANESRIPTLDQSYRDDPLGISRLPTSE